jgi:hypothetical protein
MDNLLEMGDDVYEYIQNYPPIDENIKDLIEYVHYKSMLNLFTLIMENNKDGNIDYLLPYYIEVLSKVQLIINNMKNKM